MDHWSLTDVLYNVHLGVTYSDYCKYIMLMSIFSPLPSMCVWRVFMTKMLAKKREKQSNAVGDPHVVIMVRCRYKNIYSYMYMSIHIYVDTFTPNWVLNLMSSHFMQWIDWQRHLLTTCPPSAACFNVSIWSLFSTLNRYCSIYDYTVR